MQKQRHENSVRDAAKSIIECYFHPAEKSANPVRFKEFDLSKQSLMFNQLRLRQAVFLNVVEWRADPKILNAALDRLAVQGAFKTTDDYETIVDLVKEEVMNIINARREFLIKATREGKLNVFLPNYVRPITEFDQTSNGLVAPSESFANLSEINEELELISNAHLSLEID